jgi:hypothetical protein
VGDVAAAAPHPRQLGQLVAVGDDDEVPRLPIARGGSAAAGLEDPVEILLADRTVLELAYVAAAADRVPSLHGWLRVVDR